MRDSTYFDALDRTSGDDAPHFTIRRLQYDDGGQYLELLSELTVVGNYDLKKWGDIYLELYRNSELHIFVICQQGESPDTETILASGTLLMERKFIHEGGHVGHIEDIVVSSKARGHGLGKKIVDYLVEKAESLGAYKVILDCKNELQGFYEKCGFHVAGLSMRHDC